MYRRTDPFTGYQRAEATIDSAADLLEGPTAPADGVDVLLCTHGRRDVCCGTAGTALWKELTDRLHVLGDGVRLWRTSHTGGHRFAPTGAIFPSGTYWAWLDADLLHRIVHRRGDVSDLLGHYRGSAAMPSPAVQAIEREALAAEGWAWLDNQRTGHEDPDGQGATVEFTRPDGSTGRYHGRVVVERMLPVPVCGEPIEAATKSEAELRVLDLESHS